jgi:hypothetical protein
MELISHARPMIPKSQNRNLDFARKVRNRLLGSRPEKVPASLEGLPQIRLSPQLPAAGRTLRSLDHYS